LGVTKLDLEMDKVLSIHFLDRVVAALQLPRDDKNIPVGHVLWSEAERT
jgi:hypothetical protein